MKKLLSLLFLMIIISLYHAADATDGQEENFRYPITEWLTANKCVIVSDTISGKFLVIRKSSSYTRGVIEVEDSFIVKALDANYNSVDHIEGTEGKFIITSDNRSALADFENGNIYYFDKISSYGDFYLAGKNDSISLYYNGTDLLKYNGNAIEQLSGFGEPEYMWQDTPDTINISYGDYYAPFSMNDLSYLNKIGGTYPQFRHTRFADYIINDFINDSIIYAHDNNTSYVLLLRDTLEVMIDSCSEVHKGIYKNNNRFFSYLNNADESSYSEKRMFIHDYHHNISYGPFYGSTAEFLGYDRDSIAMFSVESNVLINLKGNHTTISGAIVDVSNSFSARGICITDGIATAYVRPDELKWNKDITLDLKNWGYVEYHPYYPGVMAASEIRFELPEFRISNLLRQNILYWLSEDIASEACWYLEDWNMKDASAKEDTTFIPELNTTPQEICDYYGDCLINLFDVEEHEDEDEDGFRINFGGHFTAGTRIIAETDSLITVEFICDSNLGGGSGNGDNRHPIATFDKATGKRLILSDIFDFSHRAEIAKTINRYLHNNSGGWSISEEIPNAELLSMPFGICSDSLKFIISRHTIIGTGGEFSIPLEEFGDALNRNAEWYRTDIYPPTAGIKYGRQIPLKNVFERSYYDNVKTPKKFPTVKFQKRHPFRKQERDSSVIEAAKTINCGNNRILSDLYEQNGDHEKAEEILDILALAGYNGPMNSGSAELGKLLDLKCSIATSLLSNGEYDNAEEKARQFLWLSQDTSFTYRDSKPAMADGLILHSLISHKKGDRANSVRMAIDGGNILIPYIMTTSVRLSSSKRKELWDYYKDWCMNSLPELAFSTDDPTLARMSYDAVLNGKGMLLNTETAVRRAIEESDNSDIKQELKNLDRLTAEFEALIQKGPEKSNEPDRRAQYLQSFNSQKDSLNTLISTCREELASGSNIYSKYLRSYSATARQVCDNLLEGEVAVEFIAVETEEDPVYYALILHKGNPVPKIVKISRHEEINDTDIYGAYGESSLTDGTIYKMIWEPVAKELSEEESCVYFSPDGTLYTLPIEYSTPSDGKTQLKFHRLSSTREIAFRNDSTGHGNGEAVIFGGLDYNNCQSQAGEKQDNETRNRDFLRNYVLNRRAGIAPLPHSMDEVLEIEASLGHMNTIDKIISCTGADGSESAFKHSVSSASKIIHVATHGFYLSEDEFADFSDTDIFRNFSKDYNDLEDKELYRSALLFAGINGIFSGDSTDSQDGEDGILTAKEISMLNMSNVDLAVLSACQSGLGDISSEGVAGLQRGLKKAGANTILATLWKVDDEATKLLMSEFYQELSRGQSKSVSLANAQKFVKEYDNGKYSHPFYWAPFILIDAL